MKKGRVVKPHTSEFPSPIKLKSGERLASFEERKTNWEGWVYCKTAENVEGWVPRQYVEIHDDVCEAACDYDGTELSVAAGAELIILKEVAGWFWCVAGDKQGWVPGENVQILDPE
jgi:hypothetical protein